jgi:hypothetical protein
MATTTNYSWTTPDDTDLVKDGAAAIRTLGSSVDTTTKALNPSTTLGDIEYRSSTANTNTRLALGTAGQVLTVNSGATAPEWATVAGGYANYELFTSSTTWTVPAGITKCAVYMVGGGGGGASGRVAVTQVAGAGGGGGAGGAIGFDPFYLVTPADVITVTIGAGGSGGAVINATTSASSGFSGTAGSDTVFGSLTVVGGAFGQTPVSAPAAGNGGIASFGTTTNLISQRIGGSGGGSTNGGTGIAGNSGIISILSQAGSTGSAGDAATAGTNLGAGGAVTNAGFGGGGGGGGGVASTTAIGYDGGAASNGGGGGGGGAKSLTGIITTAGAGGNGAANRGGGGGGSGSAIKDTTASTASSPAAGNGGSGFVAIFY